MLPEDGRSALYVMGRYRIQLARPRSAASPLTADHVRRRWLRAATSTGRAPDKDAYRGPGQWHTLDVRFQAPRFDPERQQGRATRASCAC